VVGQATQTGHPERLFPATDPHGHAAQVASTGASVVVGQATQTGHPDLLFPATDPHGHGAQVASTGASVVVGHVLQTGHPERLFPDVEPHGHGAHVASGVDSTGASVVGAVVDASSSTTMYNELGFDSLLLTNKPQLELEL